VLVAQSGGGTAAESVTLSAAGSYDIYTVIFALPPGQAGADIKHNSWVVSSGSAGNFTVAPVSQRVTLGGAASVSAGWTGLTSGTRYLGVVAFSDGTSSVGQTIVAITG
jgi:hypothetical protein